MPRLSKNTWIIVGCVLVVIIIAAIFLSKNSSSAGAVERARQLYVSGDIQGAVNAYDQAKSGHQIVTAEAWSNYGNALRDNRQYEEAGAAYKQAIALDASYDTAYRNLTFLYIDLEEVQGQVGKIDEAIQIVSAGFEKTGSKSFYLAEDLIQLYSRKGDQAKVEEWTKTRQELLASS